MENRQLITLGNRNKSFSKMKNSSHISVMETQPHDTTQHYRTATEPLFQSQHPIRLVHSPSAKQNTYFPPHYHPSLGQSSVLRENSVLVSQQSFYNLPTQQSRVMESKEKSRGNAMIESVTVKSRHGSPINQTNSRSKIVVGEGQKNLLTLTLNQGTRQAQLLSKIKHLEQVITQKQIQHQQLQSIIMQEKNQNQRLNLKSEQLTKQNEQTKYRISELEEMLQGQISKSLQLMDNRESFSKQADDIRTELFVKETLIKTLQEELTLGHQKIREVEKQMQSMKEENERSIQVMRGENQSLKTQHQSVVEKHKCIVDEMQLQIKSLQSQLSTANDSLHQKQSLLTELQTQYNTKIHTLECSVSQKQTQLNSLNQASKKQSHQIQSLQTQLQSVKTIPLRPQHYEFRPEPEQDKTVSDCKKCKQLLQTVFRLNSYLNKK